MPPPQIKVDVGTGRKPHVIFLLVESDRTEFDVHMLREKLDLWHRGLQIGLDPDDLIGRLLDPSPSFERNKSQRTSNRAPVASQSARLSGQLRKMDLPGAAAPPPPQPLAAHLIIVAIVGVKNQDRRGETIGGNRVWKYGQVPCPVSVFLDAEIAGPHFRDRNEVVEGSLLLVNRESPVVHDLMVENFSRRNPVNTLHELANVIRRPVENLPQRAGYAGLNWRLEFIDICREPLGQLRLQKWQFWKVGCLRCTCRVGPW